LVSAQILIVTIALLGFFATGGLSKVSGAVSTAKSDFSSLRGKVTDFQQSIVDQPKTNDEQLTQKQKTEVVRNEGFILPTPRGKILPDILVMPKGNDFVRTSECRAGECNRPRDFSGTGGKQFDRSRKPANTALTRVQALAEIKKRGGFGF